MADSFYYHFVSNHHVIVYIFPQYIILCVFMIETCDVRFVWALEHPPHRSDSGVLPLCLPPPPPPPPSVLFHCPAMPPKYPARKSVKASEVRKRSRVVSGADGVSGDSLPRKAPRRNITASILTSTSKGVHERAVSLNIRRRRISALHGDPAEEDEHNEPAAPRIVGNAGGDGSDVGDAAGDVGNEVGDTGDAGDAAGDTGGVAGDVGNTGEGNAPAEGAGDVDAEDNEDEDEDEDQGAKKKSEKGMVSLNCHEWTFTPTHHYVGSVVAVAAVSRSISGRAPASGRPRRWDEHRDVPVLCHERSRTCVPLHGLPAVIAVL